MTDSRPYSENYYFWRNYTQVLQFIYTIIMSDKLLLLILTLFVSNVYSQDINLNIGKVQSRDYYEEIQFEFIRNKIIIPVEIAGKAYRFILDTGAPNIISTEVEQLIQPEQLQSIPVRDASGNKETLDVVVVKELKIGNTTFENTATLVYDLNASPIFKCLM